jgi:hypothetical protein
MPYTDEGKAVMLDALALVATHAGLHTAVPSTGSPNELSGGSPAYARKAIAWGAAAAGVIDDTAVSRVFDIPAGGSVAYVGFWTALSGGTLLSYDAVTNEVYGAQGTYTLTNATQDLNT